jgi:hypothetical protein
MKRPRVGVSSCLLGEEVRFNGGHKRFRFERVFAASRLRWFLSGDWEARDLVAFHARHKLQLLAHDPARHRRRGGWWPVLVQALRPRRRTGSCSWPRWRGGRRRSRPGCGCGTRSELLA